MKMLRSQMFVFVFLMFISCNQNATNVICDFEYGTSRALVLINEGKLCEANNEAIFLIQKYKDCTDDKTIENVRHLESMNNII